MKNEIKISFIFVIISFFSQILVAFGISTFFPSKTDFINNYIVNNQATCSLATIAMSNEETPLSWSQNEKVLIREMGDQWKGAERHDYMFLLSSSQTSKKKTTISLNGKQAEISCFGFPSYSVVASHYGFSVISGKNERILNDYEFYLSESIFTKLGATYPSSGYNVSIDGVIKKRNLTLRGVVSSTNSLITSLVGQDFVILPYVMAIDQTSSVMEGGSLVTNFSSDAYENKAYLSTLFSLSDGNSTFKLKFMDRSLKTENTEIQTKIHFFESVLLKTQGFCEALLTLIAFFSFFVFAWALKAKFKKGIISPRSLYISFFFSFLLAWATCKFLPSFFPDLIYYPGSSLGITSTLISGVIVFFLFYPKSRMDSKMTQASSLTKF